MIRLGLIFLFLGAAAASYGFFNVSTQLNSKFDPAPPAHVLAFDADGDLQGRWRAASDRKCCDVSIRLTLKGGQTDRKDSKKEEYSLRYSVPAEIDIVSESGKTILERTGVLSAGKFETKGVQFHKANWTIADDTEVGPKGGKTRIEILVGKIEPDTGSMITAAAKIKPDSLHDLKIEKAELLFRSEPPAGTSLFSPISLFVMGPSIMVLGVIMVFFGTCIQVIRGVAGRVKVFTKKSIAPAQ